MKKFFAVFFTICAVTSIPLGIRATNLSKCKLNHFMRYCASLIVFCFTSLSLCHLLYTPSDVLLQLNTGKCHGVLHILVRTAPVFKSSILPLKLLSSIGESSCSMALCLWLSLYERPLYSGKRQKVYPECDSSPS